MTAALLPVLYLKGIVSEEEGDLFGERPGAGEISEKRPDAGHCLLIPSMLMHTGTSYLRLLYSFNSLLTTAAVIRQ
jgi:hypothetical protein